MNLPLNGAPTLDEHQQENTTGSANLPRSMDKQELAKYEIRM